MGIEMRDSETNTVALGVIAKESGIGFQEGRKEKEGCHGKEGRNW